MKGVIRIGISMPRDLLRSVERERRATGESRSEFIRRALTASLEASRRRDMAERYVRGYLADPEDAAEIEAEGGLGLAVLSQEFEE